MSCFSNHLSHLKDMHNKAIVHHKRSKIIGGFLLFTDGRHQLWVNVGKARHTRQSLAVYPEPIRTWPVWLASPDTSITSDLRDCTCDGANNNVQLRLDHHRLNARISLLFTSRVWISSYTLSRNARSTTTDALITEIPWEIWPSRFNKEAFS